MEDELSPQSREDNEDLMPFDTRSILLSDGDFSPSEVEDEQEWDSEEDNIEDDEEIIDESGEETDVEEELLEEDEHVEEETSQEQIVEDPEPEDVLTKEEMAILKVKFVNWADKKVKTFPVSMLDPALHSIGMTPTLLETNKYRKKFDPDNRGWLKLRDVYIAAAIQKASSEPITIDQVDEAFQHLLLKYPTTQKLMMELMTICEPLNYAEANIMIKVVDPKVKGLFNVTKLLCTIDPTRIKKTKKSGKKKKKTAGKKKVVKKTKKAKKIGGSKNKV